MSVRVRLALLAACSVLAWSCSSWGHLQSDDYRRAGIRVTTDPSAVSGMHLVNRWSTETGPGAGPYSVGVWAANRLADQGRHDLVVLVELISACNPGYHDLGEPLDMWRISVYPAAGSGASNGQSPG